MSNDAACVANLSWEDVMMYYCKDTMADVFVQTPQLESKGFEMIQIKSHFNPSSMVYTRGHTVDIYDIKHQSSKSVILLKARFSCLFASLDTDGMPIHSALKVVLILPALLQSTMVSSVSFFLVSTH